MHFTALEMACGPVSDSVSTEFIYRTLQAGAKRHNDRNSKKKLQELC